METRKDSKDAPDRREMSRKGHCAVCGSPLGRYGNKFCGYECANKGKAVPTRKGDTFVPCTICLRRAGVSNRQMVKLFPMVSYVWIHLAWKKAGFDPNGIPVARIEQRAERARIRHAAMKAAKEARKAKKPKPKSEMDRYYANHEESKRKARENAKKIYNKRRNTPAFKIKQAIRNVTGRIARMTNGRTLKEKRSREILGCSYDEAREHIERQFLPGMSWENYGTAWVIDHILPLARVNLLDPHHVAIVSRYTNLQPLPKLENAMKADKIIQHQGMLL